MCDFAEWKKHHEDGDTVCKPLDEKVADMVGLEKTIFKSLIFSCRTAFVMSSNLPLVNLHAKTQASSILKRVGGKELIRPLTRLQDGKLPAVPAGDAKGL